MFTDQMSRPSSSKRLQVAYLLVVSLAGFVLRITVSRTAMWIWLLAVAVLLVGLSAALHRRRVSKLLSSGGTRSQPGSSARGLDVSRTLRSSSAWNIEHHGAEFNHATLELRI